MISHLARFGISALALIGFAGSAQALQFAEIAYDNCDSMGCDGSTLYLSVQEVSTGGWDVTYTIDTTNYTGDRNGFNQIGFKAIKDWTTGTVDSSPAGSITNWNPIYDDPIHSNSLCEGQANSTDMVCVFGFVDITDGGEFTWTFHIDDGTLIADSSEWHFGGQYADEEGEATGQIFSVDGGGSVVPEPTAAMLFGLGAVLVAHNVRRQ